jgi:hypothetical protein
MGLDVLAVSKLRFVSSEAPDEDEPGHYHFTGQPDYPDHARPLVPGYYAAEPGSEEHLFRGGSYGGYNLWRLRLANFALGLSLTTVEQFALLALREHLFAGRAFAPLLFFSDCDGEIGPTLSRLLAADFAQYQAAAEEWHRRNPATQDQMGLFPKYNDWRRAFELAADNGLVMFG